MQALPIGEISKLISQILSILKPEVSEKLINALGEIGKDDKKEKQKFRR